MRKFDKLCNKGMEDRPGAPLWMKLGAVATIGANLLSGCAGSQNTDLSKGPVFDESTQTFSFCATAGGSEVVTVLVTQGGGDTIDASSHECDGKSPAPIEANGYTYCQDLEEDTVKDGRPVKSVVLNTTNFDANEGQLYDALDRSIVSFYYSEFSCDKQ